MAVSPLSRDDIERVAYALTQSTGLKLLVIDPVASISGSWALAPEDPPAGYAFQVALFSTSRVVEAQFLPDAFSGLLVREIGSALPVEAAEWCGLVEDAERDGVRIFLRINDRLHHAADPASFPLEWRRLEITAERVFDGSDSNRDALRAAALESVAWTGLGLVLAGLTLQDIDDVEGAFDGDVSRVVATRYERKRVNRMRCIRKFGWACQICDFDFAEHYGDLGKEFIEVHHLTPLAAAGAPVLIDPHRDLIPLCSNCHRMVHRGGATLSPDEVKSALARVGARLPVDQDSAGRRSHEAGDEVHGPLEA